MKKKLEKFQKNTLTFDKRTYIKIKRKHNNIAYNELNIGFIQYSNIMYKTQIQKYMFLYKKYRVLLKFFLNMYVFQYIKTIVNNVDYLFNENFVKINFFKNKTEFHISFLTKNLYKNIRNNTVVFENNYTNILSNKHIFIKKEELKKEKYFDKTIQPQDYNYIFIKEYYETYVLCDNK